MLYAADFSAGTVDVYNGMFQRVITVGNFQDRQLPAGFAPFNVAVLDGKVYVAYAKQDADARTRSPGTASAGSTFFSLDGQLMQGSTPRALNAPWGLTIAPAGFGRLSGDLLVGNFGDGRSTRSTREPAVQRDGPRLAPPGDLDRRSLGADSRKRGRGRHRRGPVHRRSGRRGHGLLGTLSLHR